MKFQELDSDEKNAVTNTSSNLLVVSAPGSGKTTTIVYRTLYIIKRLKSSPFNIIVLTFTKNAAQNMRKRFSKLYGGVCPYFGTFHSVYYRILKKAGFTFNVIEDKDIYNFASKFLKYYTTDVNREKINELIMNISLFKSSELKIDEFKPFINRTVFCDFLSEYEKYKKDNRLYDFDDMQCAAIDLIKNNRYIYERLKDRFKFILVDEFQDCDFAQIEFLKFFDKSSHIFAVGDEDQSIYSFRGADTRYMVQFDSIFQKGEKCYLKTNYRCPKNIVDTSRKIISFNTARDDKKILGSKEEDGELKVLKFANSYEEAMFIADIITEQRKQNKKFIDFAVLYRTNDEAASTIDVFTIRGIPFCERGEKYNLYDNFICKDITAYLKLTQDVYDKDSFLRIVNKPKRYIGRLVLSVLKSSFEKMDVFDAAFENSNSLKQMRTIKILKFRLLRLSKLKPYEACIRIERKLGYLNYLKSYSEYVKNDFKEYMGIVEKFNEISKNFNRIDDFIGHIESVKDKIDIEDTLKDAVTLSTIHKVKGDQFKNVFIIDCNEGIIPHEKGKIQNIEEERRLFYVAVTRTQKNLYILYADNVNGINVQPSRFLKETSLY